MQRRRIAIQELRDARTERCTLGCATEIEQDEEQREEQKKSCCEHRLNRQWIVGDVAVDEPFHMSGSGGGRQRQADNQTSGKQHRVHDLQSDTSEVIRRSMTSAHRRVIGAHRIRSEEHTSELQSPCNLVCRLLLEKKK